jgi:hypothetical protein
MLTAMRVKTQRVLEQVKVAQVQTLPLVHELMTYRQQVMAP